jgi:hypothetical protein
MPAASAKPKVQVPAEWGYYVLAAAEIAIEEFHSWTSKPKVQVPGQWGYYVLATGEIIAEGFLSAHRALLKEGQDAIQVVQNIRKDLTPQSIWGAAPVEEPLVGIDLAAVPPAEIHVEPPSVTLELAQTLMPAPVTALTGPADRLLVFAPEDGMDVNRPEVPPLRHMIPVAPWVPFPKEPAPAPVVDHAMPIVVNVPDAPAPKPVNDKRNLIQGGGLKRAITAPLAAFPAGMMPPMVGAWNEGKGLRYRLIYRHPVAFSQASAGGIQYNLPGKFMQNPSEVVPQRYWGTYPVYYHGQMVEYDIEIENTGKTSLRDLAVTAAEEVFNGQGGPGARLPTDEGRGEVKLLKPGETVKLHNGFQITSDWTWHGSLEQTHVRVTTSAGAGQSKLLAEAYQAGIIDPPPDD